MFTAIVALVGLLCTLFGIARMVRWRRMRSAYASWPSAPGRIDASSLRTSQRTDDDDRQYDVWQPIVSYRYSVAGHDHEGSRAFWFDHVFTAEADAEHWLASVPAGASAEIRYNPANPARSALVLNQPESAPGSGLVWLGVALVIGAVFAPAFAQ